MRKISFIFIAAALLVLSAGVARAAIVLSFDPVKEHASIGGPADVDLRISGLGNGVAPSLGAFDLRVTFDAVILDFASLSFGNQLDLFGLGDFTGVTPGMGAVDLFEISLDLPSDLDTLQADSFVLATLSFNALATGVSPLNFASAILSDSLGNALGATLSSGIVVISQPASLILFGIGLAGLGAIMWRRRKTA